MIQDLIVTLIVFSTVSYTIFGFVRNLRTKKVKNGCGGCTGCDLSKLDSGCKH